jgi:hypothetical protein
VLTLATSLIALSGCGESDGDVGLFTDTASGEAETGVSATASGDSGASTSSTADTTDTAGTATADTTDTATDTSADAGDGDGTSDGSGTGPLLDVGGMSSTGTATDGTGGENCSFVDLVFVIDNSVSMGGYQSSLSIAFPMFADTLVQALPEGVNVHVGVTSTEMGFSSSGSTSISNGMCVFTGDGGQPNDAFYIEPDDVDTGTNGAQGRLFDPGGGQTYFDFYTDDSPAVIDDLKTWFASAATLGTSGSTIEMSAAPAGWVVDNSVNQATNSGFLRDEGSVLVVFFMQDEPDQTPATIDGIPGGQFVLDKIAAAKAGCGGLDCVIGGGFLNYQACSANGNLPLDDLMDGLGATAIQPLPDENTAENNPQAAAVEMNQLLSDTLADVIAQTCDEIPPVD